MKEEMKKWMVEYKDRSDYGCGEEVEAIDENHAIRIVQMGLLDDDDFMSRLLCVHEVEDQEEKEDGQWSIEGGPELTQEDQDTLNDAMDGMFNDNGESLRNAMENYRDEYKQK